MRRSEQISDAAFADAEAKYPNDKISCAFVEGFEAGANWSDGHPIYGYWFNAKEQKPEIETDLFGNVTKTVLVITMSLAKGISVNRWNGMEWVYTNDVDYWCYLPKFRELLSDKH